MRIPDRTLADDYGITPRQEWFITAAIILVAIFIGWVSGFIMAGIR